MTTASDGSRNNNGLTHLNERGEAHMVDISQKQITDRTATASGFVTMQPATLQVVEAGDSKKGDVLATARIAGIMSAKRTHDLIPLCHPLPITKASITFAPSQAPLGIAVTAQVKTTGQTGVEMEALTAVSIACLTIYDMLKAIDKTMILEGICLIEKKGGKSDLSHTSPTDQTKARPQPVPTKVLAPHSQQTITIETSRTSGDQPSGPSGDPPWDI